MLVGNEIGLGVIPLGREVRAFVDALGTLNQASGFGTAPAPITGDRTLRHLGWTRSSDRALWRIDQDDPVGFCLLSATTEVKVND